VYVARLALRDFRSYESAEIALEPGVSAFVGPNGHGKTNLVEAVAYAASLTSHRAATDGPLVRHGARQAVIRTALVRDGREAMVEIEINPGRANRARINQSPVPRAREVLGMVRTVMFAPEDLAMVKGDPAERRRFMDELLVQRAPRFAGVRSDYERVLKQRNALLKSAAAHRRAVAGSALATLDVWDSHLAAAGAELLAARLRLVEALRPLVAGAYAALAPAGVAADIHYRSSIGEGDPLPVASEAPTPRAEDLAAALREALGRTRRAELERGVSLVGPHRDDLVLRLGELPARGYASHGESWSFALGLRLAAYDLLRAGGDDPVLILDDVFAELDTGRRARLAELVAPAEQVLVTAAVPADVPGELSGAAFDVADGEVTHVR
jgi:DNA replication and repair protein RecF